MYKAQQFVSYAVSAKRQQKWKNLTFKQNKILETGTIEEIIIILIVYRRNWN